MKYLKTIFRWGILLTGWYSTTVVAMAGTRVSIESTAEADVVTIIGDPVPQRPIIEFKDLCSAHKHQMDSFAIMLANEYAQYYLMEKAAEEQIVRETGITRPERTSRRKSREEAYDGNELRQSVDAALSMHVQWYGDLKDLQLNPELISQGIAEADFRQLVSSLIKEYEWLSEGISKVNSQYRLLEQQRDGLKVKQARLLGTKALLTGYKLSDGSALKQGATGQFTDEKIDRSNAAYRIQIIDHELAGIDQQLQILSKGEYFRVRASGEAQLLKLKLADLGAMREAFVSIAGLSNISGEGLAFRYKRLTAAYEAEIAELYSEIESVDGKRRELPPLGTSAELDKQKRQWDYLYEQKWKLKEQAELMKLHAANYAAEIVQLTVKQPVCLSTK